MTKVYDDYSARAKDFRIKKIEEIITKIDNYQPISDIEYSILRVWGKTYK